MKSYIVKIYDYIIIFIRISIKVVRPNQTLNFLIMTYIGSIMAGIVLHGRPIILIPAFGWPFLAIFSVWMFTTIINDVYDEPIDRITNPDRPLVSGMISRKTYVHIGYIWMIVALITGLLMPFKSAICIVLSLAAGYIYSVPPLRLRRFLAAPMFIGIGSLLSYCTGFFSIAASPDADAVKIGVIILISLTLGPFTKDIKDVEGDRKAGVKTLFTVYSVHTAKLIVGIMLFIAYIMPVILLHRWYDIAVFAGMGLYAGIDFYKKPRLQAVFIQSFMIMLYTGIRYMLG